MILSRVTVIALTQSGDIVTQERRTLETIARRLTIRVNAVDARDVTQAYVHVAALALITPLTSFM